MAFDIQNNVLVKYIEEPGVTEVTVPDGVTEIGERAFQDCKSLTAVTLPDSITILDDAAFESCTNLVSVKLGSGIRQVEWMTFAFCKNLKAIHLPAFSGYAGWDFLMCEGMREVWLADEQIRFSDGAFNGCDSLEFIKLHHDDPVMRRNYYKDSLYLGRYINQTLDMFQSGDYSVKIPTVVKYPLTILHYLRTHDEGSTAFLQKNLTRILKESIDWGDTEFIRDITENTDWIPQKNIGKFIQLADDFRRTEIADMLRKYSETHFGTP
jgi:hypothetical protein